MAADEDDGDDNWEDEDEDDDIPWGGWSAQRRGMARESTSLKTIKNVQGQEGSWTVTDADSTKSGDRSVLLFHSLVTGY